MGTTKSIFDTGLSLHELSAKLHEVTNQNFDVKIICSDESTVIVNRILLECASEVFQAMFQHKFLESKTCEIRVTDVSSQTMKILVDYLNTGNLPDVFQLDHCEIGYIIDKYNLQCLQKSIVNILIRRSEKGDPESVYPLIVKYGNEEQKQRVAKHFARNSKFPTTEQLGKFDPFGVLEIVKEISALLEFAELNDDQRKIRWQEFFKAYDAWVKESPKDRSENAVAILELMELNLFDCKFVSEHVSPSAVFKEISPFLAKLFSRVVANSMEIKSPFRTATCASCNALTYLQCKASSTYNSHSFFARNSHNKLLAGDKFSD